MENRPVSPAPIYQGQVAIWHLADILSWLQREKGYEIQYLRQTRGGFRAQEWGV